MLTSYPIKDIIVLLYLFHIYSFMEEKKLAEGAPQSGCVDEPVLFD